MSEGKRKADGRDNGRRRFRTDGTPIWGQRSIDGPGVWVTCVKGKEKQTVGELYDLFESLSNQLWPLENGDDADGAQDSDEDDRGVDDLEKQIAKEVASMKRPRRETRFVVFISCKPPVDPVELVLTHVKNVVDTGFTQTRYSQRMTPVSGCCVANISEIQSLCTRIVKTALSAEPDKKFSYKIELRMRNHNTLKRDKLIPELAKCVPEGHTVSLDNPELFILVEIFKSVCGISVVKDYYKLQKFNVMEIANAKAKEDEGAEGRVAEKVKEQKAGGESLSGHRGSEESTS